MLATALRGGLRAPRSRTGHPDAGPRLRLRARAADRGRAGRGRHRRRHRPPNGSPWPASACAPARGRTPAPGRTERGRARRQHAGGRPRQRRAVHPGDRLRADRLPAGDSEGLAPALAAAVPLAARGATVVLAGWGPPERCATAPPCCGWPPSSPIRAPRPGGWRPRSPRRPGGGRAARAGLKPDGSGRVACPFGYADVDSAVRGLLSTGLFDTAIGRRTVPRWRRRSTEALHPHLRPDGTVWMPNVFRYLVPACRNGTTRDSEGAPRSRRGAPRHVSLAGSAHELLELVREFEVLVLLGGQTERATLRRLPRGAAAASCSSALRFIGLPLLRLPLACLTCFFCGRGRRPCRASPASRACRRPGPSSTSSCGPRRTARPGP